MTPLEWLHYLCIQKRLDSVLFKTALSCCERLSFWQYQTDLYPAYLILCACQDAYTELGFMEFTYKGNTVQKTSQTAGSL